jgi:hypothetical protein
MRFNIPVLDTTVNTNDPSGSASNVVSAVIAVAMMFGIVAAAKFVYNRARAGIGVGQDNNPVPGV